MAKKRTHTDDSHMASLFGEAEDFVFNKPATVHKEEVEPKPAEESVLSEAKIEPECAFHYISFGSGSSGNCSYIGTGKEGVLIDAGIDSKKVYSTLASYGIKPESIKGICLTHDHGDHVRYAYNMIRKYPHMGVFCTNRVLNGMLRRHNISRRIKDQHVAIFKEIPFKIAGLQITAFEVPHDGTDNMGFFIEYGDKKFTIATDLGHINDRAEFYLKQANFMMLESNYDLTMLQNGKYPEYLKNRIIEANGHLDNKEGAQFVSRIIRPELKFIFLCHLSNDNNTPEIAFEEYHKALSDVGKTIGNGENTIEDNQKDIQIIPLPRFEATREYILR